MWTDLPGWDKPSEENAKRVAFFQRGEFQKKELTLPYRLYQSEQEGALPLVVFLHGADVVGSDNESQLAGHDVGTVFATKEWQAKHPCHIIAPQYQLGMHWANPVMTDLLQSFVEQIASTLQVDQSRIYLYGYSAGAIGIFSLLKKYPQYYAAAIPICGATQKKNIENIAKTPIWMFHAADDPVVPAGKTNMGIAHYDYLGSHTIAEKLRTIEGAEVHYTEYPAGEMMEQHGLHAHCTWVLMGRDEEAKEWLFSQRRL